MSFLQPWLLIGLPLLLLPIIIHLINQWRYQTKRWGAMMFLLAANKMAKGYAKLRQYLILAMRVLAILGLIFAISRPLASGFLGIAGGGKADTTIIMLDRSPSMQQQSLTGNESKLDAAKRQLRQTLQSLGSNRWVLIDSATNQAREFERLDDLFDSPETRGLSATADVPGMMQSALVYLQNNRPGQTEVWLCSDLRQSDWNSTSSQWPAIRDGFRKFPQSIRFHLLSFTHRDNANLSVRVTNVQREYAQDSHELVMSLVLQGDEDFSEKRTIPLQIEVNGARSELAAEMVGSTLEIKDHRVPIDTHQARGWGRVSIPADPNLSDNEYYFVFDEPPPRRTIVVYEDPLAAKPLELAASISPNPHWKSKVESCTPDRAKTLDWDDVGLLLWQGSLPEPSVAQDIAAFLKRGGQIVFFPPTPGEGQNSERGFGNTSNAWMGIRWSQWKTLEARSTSKLLVENWRSDQDLLAATRSGASLPVGQIELDGYAILEGEAVTLASLAGGQPLLARAATEQGGAYFFAASPSPKYSNLARSGIVLYVAIQRALDRGVEALGTTLSGVAGQNVPEDDTVVWQQKDGPKQAISTEYPWVAGAYDDGQRLLSINRWSQEDFPTLVEDQPLRDLFQGLRFDRVESQAGETGSIVREVWRVFLVLMLMAMVVEALLCIPRYMKSPAGFPGAKP